MTFDDSQDRGARDDRSQERSERPETVERSNKKNNLVIEVEDDNLNRTDLRGNMTPNGTLTPNARSRSDLPSAKNAPLECNMSNNA